MIRVIPPARCTEAADFTKEGLLDSPVLRLRGTRGWPARFLPGGDGINTCTQCAGTAAARTVRPCVCHRVRPPTHTSALQWKLKKLSRRS